MTKWLTLRQLFTHNKGKNMVGAYIFNVETLLNFFVQELLSQSLSLCFHLVRNTATENLDLFKPLPSKVRLVQTTILGSEFTNINQYIYVKLYQY